MKQERIKDAPLALIRAQCKLGKPIPPYGAKLLLGEIDALRAIIQDAPHHGFCDADSGEPCDCWKAKVLKGGE